MADRASSQCTSTRCRRTAGGAIPGRRAAQGARLCAPCSRTLLRDLQALPALYEESEQYLTPASSTALTQRVTGTRENTLPVSETALEARHDTLARISSWARLVADERSCSAASSRTVAALAGFLAGHADWLVTHPAAGRAADELAATAAALRNLSATPRAQLVPLGSCVEPGCDAEVSLPRRGGDDLVLRGPMCAAGHVLTPRQWLALKAAS
ncbi:hypothetical protein [Streptomyces sp. H27-D2]|uniref:hypothetical protein n=1 Tax=Streptomyces sp. H27-D2 TaxID=3046304 RepID=UPI002DBED8DD|nr:hypothetical protein [Streptomyces sp. H27-D2]MEC4015046.1 hypothetical protein [Streptomyces sp. H27-D2]